jgi:hypothetical protein
MRGLRLHVPGSCQGFRYVRVNPDTDVNVGMAAPPFNSKWQAAAG